MRDQRIKTRTGRGIVTLGGWLASGCSRSYVRFDCEKPGWDYLEGAALYRLAKAIVRRHEADKAFRKVK